MATSVTDGLVDDVAKAIACAEQGFEPDTFDVQEDAGYWRHIYGPAARAAVEVFAERLRQFAEREAEKVNARMPTASSDGAGR